MHPHTRFALMRADGRWFKHPNGVDPTEWSPRLGDAHLWVDLDACKAAAYLYSQQPGALIKRPSAASQPHGQLRCEDVLPLEVLVYPNGQRIQATYSNVSA